MVNARVFACLGDIQYQRGYALLAAKALADNSGLPASVVAESASPHEVTSRIEPTLSSPPYPVVQPRSAAAKLTFLRY